ncbi:MAG TPA: hypothetical protein VLQ67_15380 [Arachnia sp.]|nr:hypothetical protein [Arachnia sp.]
MVRPVLALLCALSVLAACSPAPEPTPPSSSAPAPSASSAAPASTSPTTSSPSASPSLLDFTTAQTVLLPEFHELAPPWEEVFALPYGEGEDQLGTSPGGEGLEWGPSYGTQLPDGTWWFLDTANFRLAHFDEAGSYLGDAPFPEEHLAQGEFLQWQSPQALADGTVMLQSTTPDRPGMLRMAPDGTFSRVELDRFPGLKATDGTSLFGFDEDGRPVVVDPADGSLAQVDSFAGQGGLSYFVEAEPGSVSVQVGDLSLPIPLQAADHPDALVYPSIEAATGTDGVLTLLVSGIAEVETGVAVDASAVLRINAAGAGTVESVPMLTSEADPGDGARLGIRLGDDRPWLMVVDADALRVYRRG